MCAHYFIHGFYFLLILLYTGKNQRLWQSCSKIDNLSGWGEIWVIPVTLYKILPSSFMRRGNYTLTERIFLAIWHEEVLVWIKELYFQFDQRVWHTCWCCIGECMCGWWMSSRVHSVKLVLKDLQLCLLAQQSTLSTVRFQFAWLL